jgi:hypothetical protein
MFRVFPIASKTELGFHCDWEPSSFVAMRDSSTIQLTAPLIRSGATAAGGWTAEQLNLIGVDWPPESGWIKRAEGREVDVETFDLFLALGSKHLRRIN